MGTKHRGVTFNTRVDELLPSVSYSGSHCSWDEPIPQGRVSMSADIVGRYTGGVGAAGISWIESRNSAKHSTMYRTEPPPQQSMIQAPKSVLLRVREPALSNLTFVCVTLQRPLSICLPRDGELTPSHPVSSCPWTLLPIRKCFFTSQKKPSFCATDAWMAVHRNKTSLHLQLSIFLSALCFSFVCYFFSSFIRTQAFSSQWSLAFLY